MSEGRENGHNRVGLCFTCGRGKNQVSETSLQIAITTMGNTQYISYSGTALAAGHLTMAQCGRNMS
jgi:hypothetical protein